MEEDTELFLAAFRDSNLRDDTPLIAAITGHDQSTMHALIQSGCDLNKRGIRDTPLMSAIKARNQSAVDTLIYAGCDLEASGGSWKDENALITTVKEHNYDALNALIKAGCNLTARNLSFGLDNEEYTILHLAAELAAVRPHKERVSILKLLMDNINDTSVITSIDEKKDSALIKFIRRYGDASKYSGHVVQYYNDCVDILTSNAKVITAQPWTLAFAVENGTVAACETILSRDEECVNLCFPGNESPLHCAVRITSFAKCKLLVRYKARMDVLWRDMNPLELALSLRCKTKIIELLQNHLRDTNALNTSTDTNSFSFLTYKRSYTLNSYCNDFPTKKQKFSNRDQELLAISDQALCEDDYLQKSSVEYRELISTTIPFSHKEIDQEQVIKLIASAHNPNLHIESKHILRYTEEILNQISHQFSLSKETSHFQFQIIFAGSMAEGIKTFIANELDVICQFLENPIVDPRGKIDVERESLWFAAMCDEQLYIRSVAQAFYQAFEIQLRSILLSYNEINPDTTVCLHRGSLDLKDKISCLQLLWRSKRYGDTIVHIDLVPAFNDPKYTPIILMPTNAQVSKQYHRIAKTSRHHFASNIIFPDSHACAEVSFIQQLPRTIKRGLIRAKALRISIVSQPADMSHIPLTEGETISSEDFITSYMLKTCLIRLMRESTKFEGSEYDWADRIYAKIESCVKNKKLETHYDDAQNVFECRHDDDSPPAGCCIKRKVILVLCRTIREWLRNNKEAINMQYGKYMIYSRKKYVIGKVLGRI